MNWDRGGDKVGRKWSKFEERSDGIAKELSVESESMKGAEERWFQKERKTDIKHCIKPKGMKHNKLIRVKPRKGAECNN